MLHPQTLDLAIPLIEEFEGVLLEAYLCPAGVPTICAGVTRYPDGTPVMLGDVCTEAACSGYLLEMLAKEFVPCLQTIPGFDQMGPHRQAALLSFAWNMGARFYGSENFETISRVLRTKAYGEMRGALMLYRKAGGKVLKGLERRREREADLWEAEDFGPLELVATDDTWLKAAPIDSRQLADDHGKRAVESGDEFALAEYNECAVENHSEIVLEGTGERWFIYDPHWKVLSAKKH